MRLFAATLAAVLAAPILGPAALAQPYPSQPYQPNPQQDFDWRTQQEMLRQQMVQQQNQMMALEAQMRAQQAIQDVRAQSQSARLPPVDTTPGHALPHIDTSRLAAIPDSALAESNRKVLDAANRR